MRIISFIDQPEVIKKILEHLGLWEESHAPPNRKQGKREITFDPAYTNQFKPPLLQTRENVYLCF